MTVIPTHSAHWARRPRAKQTYIFTRVLKRDKYTRCVASATHNGRMGVMFLTDWKRTKIRGTIAGADQNGASDAARKTTNVLTCLALGYLELV